MLRILSFAILSFFLSLASAQAESTAPNTTVDQAEKLFQEGEYDRAYPIF